MSDVKAYLGDGVYADLVNGHIKLTTEDGGPIPSNTIYLEHQVWMALKDWVETIERAESDDEERKD